LHSRKRTKLKEPQDAEAMERSAPKRNGNLAGVSRHPSKRREPVKGHTEEPGNGDNCKRGASQSEPGPTRIPTGVRIKKEKSQTLWCQNGSRSQRHSPRWPRPFPPKRREQPSIDQERRIRRQDHSIN